MSIDFMFKLRKAMQDKGMSASELSRLSGVGKSDICYYLKGRYVPKQDKCYMLAKALDVDPGWLMVGEEITPVVSGHSSQILYDEVDPPYSPEARILAKGIDTMPPEQREAIVKMMMGLYPGVFEKGTENDDA